jgi:hypothetical protein
VANNLAFLEIDLTDPDFHRLALQNSRATLAKYPELLDEAVAAREIVTCDTARLARALSALSSGSMLNWEILREGDVDSGSGTISKRSSGPSALPGVLPNPAPARHSLRSPPANAPNERPKFTCKLLKSRLP